MMTEHRIATQEDWQAERDELLTEEKALTRRSDELARKRRDLPWVAVEKDYTVRDRDRHEESRRAVRRPLAAHRLPLHVRSGIHRGLPGLLVDGRRVRAPRSRT